MRRSDSPTGNSITAAMAKVLSTGDGSPSVQQKLQLLQELRDQQSELADAAVGEVLGSLDRMSKGLRQASMATAELRQRIDELVGKLWFPAVFLGFLGELAERRAIVFHGSAARVVGVWDNVQTASLAKGCEVMLNHELTAIVATSPRQVPPTGEIATVVEKTDRGSLIVRSHDVDVEVELAASLAEVELKASDRVRWSPQACIAFERVEQGKARKFMLGEIPDIGLDAVGGQDDNLRRLVDALSSVLIAPDKAADYQLSGRSSVLLVGAAGCGKTLMVKAAVAHIARMTGRKAHFYLLKPAELESWLVGASEKNVRDFFASMRESVQDGSLAVLFLDEVECLGRIRGHVQGHHSDKTLNAWLAELDGFTGRDNIALVATTNRPDLIDNALKQRLSDDVIHIGPPDLKGARAIFSIHLRSSLPYSPNGTMAAATREELIETAVSRLYNPNSPYAQLLRLKFRDGKARLVSARDFVNGRLLEQVCRSARLSAYQRELRTGQRGLQVSDIEESVCAAMHRLVGSISIHNVRDQIQDLPTDVDVVAVERILHKVTRPHQYVLTPQETNRA